MEPHGPSWLHLWEDLSRVQDMCMKSKKEVRMVEISRLYRKGFNLGPSARDHLKCVQSFTFFADFDSGLYWQINCDWIPLAHLLLSDVIADWKDTSQPAGR